MKDKLDDKIKAILFDLDNTLIEVDLDKFIPQYLNLLAQSVAHIISPKKFIAKILVASKAVEENDGKKSNEDVYAEKFFPLEGYSREEIKPFFDKFYKEEFCKLKQYTKKKPEARSVVQKAFNKGYDVVIATTPMLPATAIEQRLEWAGVADFPYRLITTIENSHASKSLTHLLYYDQILDKIGYPAEKCLMIGDDDKDLVARRLGMLTYLIDQNNKKLNPEIPEPTYKGSLKGLKHLL
ncbi:MAG: HAD family hydrolase [Candidatus Thorarchaeota archaeon]